MNYTEACERYGVREWGVRAPAAVRLLRNSVESSGGCWLWQAAVSGKGYGSFRTPQGSVIAHRAAYELFLGPIAPGMHLDHLCRVRHCINPMHLEQVTPAENVRRGVVRRAAEPATHCRRGHEFTPETTTWQGRYRRCLPCRRLSDARCAERRRAARTTQ